LGEEGLPAYKTLCANNLQRFFWRFMGDLGKNRTLKAAAAAAAVIKVNQELTQWPYIKVLQQLLGRCM